jgi:hypothetical protein
MSLSTSERRRGTARKLVISAAALLVTVLPTACDYAYAGSPGNGVAAPAAGGSGHGNHSSEGGQGSDGSDDSNGSGNNDGNNNNGDDNGGGSGDDNGGGGGGNGDNNENDGNNNENDGDDNGNDGNGGGEQPPQENNGLDVIGRDCSESELPPHDGFQLAPRCVSTAFGEVAGEDKSPSLLITDAPRTVKAKEKFTISVSTRNLVRDRFLGAAAGGYYLESSFLTEDGIQRGHFHSACRMLESTDVAPDAEPAPAFFLATQDNGGGAEPDTVKVTVTGLPTTGTAQCAVWAGDGSHRIPMMQRADQTPAFDAVRIDVE